MQSLRPTDEIRAVLYASPHQEARLIAVENVLRDAFPGQTRSSSISPTREGDGLHLIITIKIREVPK